MIDISKDEIIALMTSSLSEDEWAANCDKVKAACRDGRITDLSGHYPSWWYAEIVMSGLMARVSKGFRS